MTLKDASQKVLTVLFGMKVPARRPCVRTEKPAPPKPESKWAERSQAECLQKIGEVCERNKAKAPEGYGLWPAARLMNWTEEQMRKHFADTEKEEEGASDV